MDKNTVVNIIQEFRKALEEQGIKVRRLILFGSCVTDRQRDDSDIDLVVISEDFEGKDFWDRIDLLTEALYKVFQPIEAIALTPEEWEAGVSPVVAWAQNGEVVYAA